MRGEVKGVEAEVGCERASVELEDEAEEMRDEEKPGWASDGEEETR